LGNVDPEVLRVLEQIRTRLLDLSKRNRLLNYRHNKLAIRIVDEQPRQVFSRLVGDDKEMKFGSLPDPQELNGDLEGDVTESSPHQAKESLRAGVAEQAGINIDHELPASTESSENLPKKHLDNKLQTRLFKDELEARQRRIRSKARSIIQETGMNQLFLAMGFLEWKDGSDPERSWIAPLILIPVELIRGQLNARTHCYEYYVKYTGEDLSYNLSLSVKVEAFDILLPTFDECIQEGGGYQELDPEAYFEKVSRAIEDQKGWRVSRQMVLGFFAFSRVLMWKDLDPSAWPEAALSNHDLVNILVGRDPAPQESGPSPESDSEQDDAQTFQLPLVVDADSSQVKAIKSALNGQSLIIQGPPGTGKSQTITNLIACFLQEKKSVLFVAEKMAALDVVRRNLKRVNLYDFCLELHSYKADKKAVLKSLKEREMMQVYDARQLDSVIVHTKETAKRLAKYTMALSSPIGPFGETVFQVIGKAESLREKLKQPPRIFCENATDVKESDFQNAVDLLDSLSRCITELGVPRQSIWNGFAATEVSYGDETVISEVLTDALDAVNKVLHYLESVRSEAGVDLDESKIGLVHLRGLSGLPEEQPSDIHQNILRRFLLEESGANWKALRELARTIDAHAKKVEDYSVIIDSSSEMAIDEVEELNSLLSDCERLGFGSMTLELAARFIDSSEKIIVMFRQSLELAEKHVAAGFPELRSISSLKTLVEIDGLVRDRPSGLDPAQLEKLLDRSVRGRFIDLVERGRSLEEQKSRLSETFAIRDAPPVESLCSIRQVIRSRQGRLFASLSKDYRKAKLDVLSFARERSVLKSKTLSDDLDELETFLIAKDSFESKSGFAQVFGRIFRGLDTDWTKLDALILWATQLSSVLGTDTSAKSLLMLSPEEIGQLAPHQELKKVASDIEQEYSNLMALSSASEWEEVLGELFKSSPKQMIEKLAAVSEIARRLIKLLSSIIVDTNSSFSRIFEGITLLREAIRLRGEIDTNTDAQSLLGESFRGSETPIDEIDRTVDFAKSIKEHCLADELIHAMAMNCTQENLTLLRRSSNKWLTDLSAIERIQDVLGKLGDVDEDVFWAGKLDTISLAAIKERLSELISAQNSLLPWSDYCRFSTDADSAGLAEIRRLLHTGELLPELAADTYRFMIYDSLAKDSLRTNRVLSRFSRVEYESFRDRFADLDKKAIELQQKRIACTAINHSKHTVPEGRRSTKVRELTDMRLLRHEFAKEKRHVPIRRLMERAGAAIRGLKPVFMMSPMSTAQFLEPGKHEFDVVIMDEASQILPEDALGAIARGKQLVVVGDSKQLPPTTFFRSEMENPDDPDEETIFDDMDAAISILDKCEEAHLRSSRLLWHYRSEHESLIAFSNSQWYNNELIVFPSAGRSDTKLGIEYHYVENATYAAGKNECEADVVARKIIEHAIKSPILSLGVGTFNIKQRDLIEDRLTQLLKDMPAAEQAVSELMKANDGYEPLFIKNLENLQGDQRDVIFISCTFGPDPETGRVYNRFGPVNQANGPRRLNVLFTRAKKRMEVFSSMRPDDIIADPGYLGRVALKKFLKYAETGRMPEFGVRTDREFDSDFEMCVARAIERMGYEIEPQVGVAGYFIDIGVRHPHRKGEYMIGVECDGATYHSSTFARDRDRLREEVLYNRDWRLHRIWSTEWFKNRQKEVERLEKALSACLEEDKHVIKSIADEPVEEISVPVKLRSRIPDSQLERRLFVFCKQNIPRSVESQRVDGFLHPDILKAIVRHRPTDRAGFTSCVPFDLRVNLHEDDGQYLDDLLEIIEQAGY